MTKLQLFFISSISLGLILCVCACQKDPVDTAIVHVQATEITPSKVGK